MFADLSVWGAVCLKYCFRFIRTNFAPIWHIYCDITYCNNMRLIYCFHCFHYLFWTCIWCFFFFFAAVDYYVYYTVPCCFFFGLFCLRFSYHHSLKNWSLKWECGWSWLDEHCSFASSTVCIDCGFALFSFYRCHCVPLFVHAERINYWLTDYCAKTYCSSM